MTDFSKVSNEELMRMLQQGAGQAPQSSPEIGNLSDEELMRRFQKTQPAPTAPEEVIPEHNWSELGQTWRPSGTKFFEGVKHMLHDPVGAVKGVRDIAQGAADANLPEWLTDFLDQGGVAGSHLRTPEEKQRVIDAWKQFKADEYAAWGGIERGDFRRAKNTIITDPFRAVAEIGSIADPALRVVGRGITPLRAEPSRLRDVEYLRGEGVPLTAGDVTGRRQLQVAEDELGGGKLQDFRERQGEAYTAAAMRRAGTQANRAEPHVMEGTATGIGDDFERLGASNTLISHPQVTNQLYAEVNQALRNYQGNLPSGGQGGAQIVYDTARDIQQVASRNAPGSAYQTVRSAISRAERGATDPAVEHTLRAMREALDDAMERSIAATNPGDLGAFRRARSQYYAMLALEKAAVHAKRGIITPARLATGVRSAHGERAYVRGRGPLTQLAHSGENVIERPANSMTGARSWARGAAATILGGLSAAGTYLTGGDLLTGGMLSAGAAVPGLLAGPTVMGRALMSPTVQRYLGNQIVNNSRLTQAARRAGLPALRTPANVAARSSAVLSAEERQRRRRGKIVKTLEK